MTDDKHAELEGIIRWSDADGSGYEYAIQQGPHGDEFVQLYNRPCLRRKAALAPQPALEQDPVAWIALSNDQENVRIWWRRKDLADDWSKIHSAPIFPLYAHPQCVDALLPLAPKSPALDPATVEALRELLDYHQGYSTGPLGLDRLAEICKTLRRALLASPIPSGEPVAWQYRTFEHEDWSGWTLVSKHFHDAIAADKAEGRRSHYELRALYAAPCASKPDSSTVRANGYGCVKPDTDQQVFFYEQDFYVLSNFSAFTLDWQGWRFDTSEAAYHWEKFAHMNEMGIVGGHECHQCYVIRRAPSAHAAFKIAEANRAARRANWDEVKVGIMRDILRAKVNQHEYVRRKLLATGDRELIEDSWRDDFWGWGPNRDGKNTLGKLWMEVRAELRGPVSLQDGAAK